MIFLCFAVKDRIPLVNDFYHYLSTFGLEIWYDRRNIYLGDNRIQENIYNGAANSTVNYAVIFYSENFINGNICLDEFDILVKRYEEKEVFIFPVFLSSVPNIIDTRFKICTDLVYKQISNQKDFYALSLHIVAKITDDELHTIAYHTFDAIEQYCIKDEIIHSLIIEYQNIRKTNYSMRIAFLFSIFVLITHKRKVGNFHIRTMNFIYHQNCLNAMTDEKRELQIMENILIYEIAFL